MRDDVLSTIVKAIKTISTNMPISQLDVEKSHPEALLGDDTRLCPEDN